MFGTLILAANQYGAMASAQVVTSLQPVAGAIAIRNRTVGGTNDNQQIPLDDELT